MDMLNKSYTIIFGNLFANYSKQIIDARRKHQVYMIWALTRWKSGYLMTKSCQYQLYGTPHQYFPIIKLCGNVPFISVDMFTRMYIVASDKHIWTSKSYFWPYRRNGPLMPRIIVQVWTFDPDRKINRH